MEGIYKEATESPETALGYYTKLLEEDPANVVSDVISSFTQLSDFRSFC